LLWRSKEKYLGRRAETRHATKAKSLRQSPHSHAIESHPPKP